MNRRKFLVTVASGSVLMIGGTGYLLSDKDNFVRSNEENQLNKKSFIKSDEREILYLASLAPSGHNTQPWFVKYLNPYHWIICNDKNKWLPAVDPSQRETILSIGTFLQNLEYAANNLGFICEIIQLAVKNQDEDIVEIKLIRSKNTMKFDINKILNRRTLRSNFLNDLLKEEHQNYLFSEDQKNFTFFPRETKNWKYLNEKTIEANKIQSYRDPAEKELSEWIRFSSKDSEKFRDGLTPATMEIEGISGWIVRNFYDKESVMKDNFREKNIENVIKQVSQSAGWLLITSKDSSVTSLLETGKTMQRLFLKVRESGIAIHPMTQILEESSTNKTVNQALGITDDIQFILRLGYVENYPKPVSLRRPVDWFIKN